MEEENRGYNRLKVYRKAQELANKVHKMTLLLPKYELYEEGTQIRKSSKSVASNIVEGYALRKYRREFIHYIYRAYGSSEETIVHLNFLNDTGSLKNKYIYNELKKGYFELNRMLFRFIEGIEKEHSTPNFLFKNNIEK
jgi:four helix bundle protein